MRHDLISLRLFLAICEHRSLSRAAKRMNMALSAASRRLRLLEEEVGTQLVERLPHGIEVTTSGVTMQRYAQSVLRLADQLESNIAEHRLGVRGRVRVFASSSALVQRLASDLAYFARSHPEIKIDLEERPTSETLEALYNKQADIGVIVRGAATTGLTTYAYDSDRLALAVYPAHRLAGRRSVTLGELVDEEFVALDVGTAVHRLIVGKAREIGAVLKLRVQVRSFEVMCQMVRYELGIGILPEGALRSLAEALGLLLIPLDEPWAEREIALAVSAEDEMAPPTRRLLETLQSRALSN